MKRKTFKVTFFVLVLLISYSLSFNRRQFVSDDLVHIWFLNVGQGDSILIKTPAEKYILVDGNGDGYESIRGLLPPGECNLEVVVLTHPHFDHFSGLNSIIDRCKIMTFIRSSLESESKSFKSLQEKMVLAQSNGKLKVSTVVKSSDDFSVDNIVLDLLWPLEYSSDYTNFNNSSVVLLLTFQDFDLLLTGDAEKAVYDQLMDENTQFNSIEVLKYPHHGSKDAFNEVFLGQIRPMVSVISVGEGNKYGHPSQLVLDSLTNLRSKVYRTDRNGTIEIITDGKSFQVLTER